MFSQRTGGSFHVDNHFEDFFNDELTERSVNTLSIMNSEKKESEVMMTTYNASLEDKKLK